MLNFGTLIVLDFKNSKSCALDGQCFSGVHFYAQATERSGIYPPYSCFCESLLAVSICSTQYSTDTCLWFHNEGAFGTPRPSQSEKTHIQIGEIRGIRTHLLQPWALTQLSHLSKWIAVSNADVSRSADHERTQWKNLRSTFNFSVNQDDRLRRGRHSLSALAFNNPLISFWDKNVTTQHRIGALIPRSKGQMRCEC